MSTTLHRGENRILSRFLKQSDGTTNATVSAFTVITATLSQRGDNIVTYTHGTDAQLRTGGESNEVELEITNTVTRNADPGPLDLLWIFSKTDETKS